MTQTVAFIGLGNMGAPMASNLVSAGFTVIGHDLSESSRAAAASAGIRTVGSLHDAVASAEAVITMLPAGKHVLSVWTNLVRQVRTGTLLVDCSTIDLASARLAHQVATGANCPALDAPVSGGTGGAAAGTLTFMVGGAQSALEKSRPLLDAMGKRVVYCGEAGAGQAAKLCNNMILGITMAGVCEAFVLGEKLGLMHQALFDVASTSSGQCWSINTYCPVPGPVPTSPANNGYKPGFTSSLMLKDLKLSQEAAMLAGATTPMGSLATQLYTLMEKLEGGDMDFSAIIKMFRERGTVAIAS